VVNRSALLSAATHEVLVARTTPRQPLGAFHDVHHDNLRRGVRYRVLFPDTARTTPGLSTQLGALALAGGEVRTLPTVPMDALVIDGSVAVLPSDRHQGGLAMFQLSGVVTATSELFEHLWPLAVPLSTGSRPRPELSPREQELLSLLFAGSTDESAAARLGISVRTVRRTVSDIMNRLGARSRFQAGAKAADRGWLLQRAG
jgi:DNA-binding CsgD family transcriptional regulator